MNATTADFVDQSPNFDRRQLIGALVLLGLLILLPIFGIGPTTWQQSLGAADTTAAKAPAPQALPQQQPPTEPQASAAPPATPMAAAPPPSLPAATGAPASEPPALTQPAAPTPAPSAPKALATAPRAVIYFGFDDDDLPGEARRRLAPIVTFLKANRDAKTQISGYHDTRGNRIYNEDLAQRRAVAVRAALERAGIERERIVLAKPAKTTGSGKPEEARRTEVTIVR